MKSTVGVISDTHGLLRPEALAALQGADLILHAGDIGAPEILDALAHIAPLKAVRGNIDTQPWAESLPATDAVEVAGVYLYVLHDLKTLDLNPSAAGFAAVISGHSHKASQAVRDGVLYFNPGSAGPRRFRLPISVGRLSIADGHIVPEIIKLG
jgi:putative phosphoesterase